MFNCSAWVSRATGVSSWRDRVSRFYHPYSTGTYLPLLTPDKRCLTWDRSLALIIKITGQPAPLLTTISAKLRLDGDTPSFQLSLNAAVLVIFKDGREDVMVAVRRDARSL